MEVYKFRKGRYHDETNQIKIICSGYADHPGVIASLAGFDETFAADKLVSGSVRSSSNNNPIMDHKFAADPFARLTTEECMFI